MRVLQKNDLEKERAFYVKKLKDSLFIYPTDTIYGIGCNAEDRTLVRKLRQAKEQFSRPLSVIVPGKDWIYENCEVTQEAEKWLEKLPGPYTFILKLKNNDAVCRATNLECGTIGVRQPDLWFTKVVEDMGVPVITTSANITGGKFMRDPSDLHEKLRKEIEYLVEDGRIEGQPSTIVDLTGDSPEIIRN